MKRLSLLCLSLFVGFAAPAAATCTGTDLRPSLSASEQTELASRIDGMPYASGNHWKAMRGGQVLHVIGTVHMDDARLAPVVARLEPLLATADRLYLEATAKEQDALQKAISTRPELLFLTDGPTLPELMPEEAWQALADAARVRGIPAFLAAKFQPWYLSVMLSLPACAVQQIQAGTQGLDAQLMARADAAGLPQIALEPYDTLFQIMGAEPLERQVEFLSLGILTDRAAEDGFATLLASYFAEETAEIMEVSRLTARRHLDMETAEVDALFDEMVGTILVKRNLAWMETLLAAPDGVSVVAVGAGHLPGEDGVLDLLSDAGFTLERQTF